MDEKIDEDDVFQRFLEWRGVEKPCKKCGGSGVVVYPTTATWQGGAGGMTITSGACDRCWGSGDEERKWTNLRSLYLQIRETDGK